MTDSPRTGRPTLRDLWRAGETTLGGWLSLPTAISAEATARAGFDYVCVDTQHGVVDYPAVVDMITAIELGGSNPIVRVPWNEPGIIGKVLDAGAQGVIVPMVNTVEQAEAAVQACRYAPDGSRSFGPVVPRARIGPEYVTWAAENVAVIPMIETVEAISNLDAILAVPGIDAVYVGPADLSLTLGLPPGNNDDAPGFDDALSTIVAGCDRAGIVCGIHSTGPLTPRRLAAGFRMVTVTSDLVALNLGTKAELDRARSGDTSDAGGSIY